MSVPVWITRPDGRPLTGPAAPGGPAVATPPLRPGLVRRTTTHDSLRPAGLAGPVTLDARGRDIRVEADGAATVLDAARVTAEIGGFPARAIARIEADPGHPGLAALVGRGAAAGFRQAVDDALPGERASHSVRHQLLDDLPTALLVSGYALQFDRPARVPPRGLALQYPDLCAGWVAGGTIISGIETTGRVPLPLGPPVPPVDADDPDGWHETEPLPAHGMRRRRRIDVWRAGGERGARVECFFRDSHVDPDGVETAVHEYTVRATVDVATTTFTSCVAEFGALPWSECPGALASAGRLVGRRPDGLRRLVRDTFTGTSTCTHLNDTLRSLEDVGALVAQLPGADTDTGADETST
ncbi:DUF2889 domain-containing protein [Frankia sp. CNm7]|uniref:DUF2889 domain-containing protein n=1 Tax=Frankia nepalensis TaxID=1836974 RepID=A0A937UT80_9ACTN|nr:DUF2889 domain-containing protein [Frankia nepalensis]MBL7500933.1 DUF2889 domain-containing protein [Frankia nepalensis]MBL7510092.1 DUF2889 domain-containing protein [Frankia nepalensis]MBL7518440.1 DUF2889 domain-containing protein [Frankia nepalensis]MBL7633302.1 DUF2889 domain-containing protein [Frankia nepalensis]